MYLYIGDIPPSAEDGCNEPFGEEHNSTYNIELWLDDLSSTQHK